MKKIPYLVLSASLLMGAARAQLRVEIAGVGSNRIPVAVAAFAGESVAPEQVSAIIRADLERSGIFKVIDARQSIGDQAGIDYAAFKASGADAVVVGTVEKQADGRLGVRYKLFDTVKQAQLSARSDTVQLTNTRLEAHRIADDVYEKLTGERGAFATRISYIRENRQLHDYRLEVADADGEGIVPVFRSNQPLISPAWSPDGSKVAYASYEQNKPVVYVHDLVSRQRRVLANEKGNISAPSWSPDGTKLALAMSKAGGTQLFVINADGSDLHRLSYSTDIDTEPQWAPDGQTIYFSSNRGGSWHIYKMNAAGGNATRVTFKSGDNYSPRISPDGKTLAWIAQREGVFSLFALDLASGQDLLLADGATEPSFSPNGKYIMYANHTGDRTSLAVVSVDGRVKQRLTTQAGNIKEPSWGPFVK
jgi:TolB protein